MNIRQRLQLLASISALILPIGSEAGLIGDTVSGSMSSFQSAFPTFSPNLASATVGPGAELTGTAIDIFGQSWNVVVDVDATSIKMSWTAQAPWGGTPNLAGGDGLLAIDLTFSDSMFDSVSLANYENTGAFSNNSVPHLSSLGFSGHTLQARFNTLLADDSYTFAVHAIPEPSSLALVCLGFSVFAIGRRKQLI